jgi:tetratricopeptide (TPR) repeat protein
LYLALLRMTGWAGRSAAAAVLWGVHPLRVESVAWIAERKDVLSVLFLMLALLAYDWYCRRPGVGRYLAVLGSMLGSLLCKSTLVTLPVLLFLLDIWPLGRLELPWLGRPERGAGEAAPYPPRSFNELVLEKLPLCALAAAFVAITLVAQSKPMEFGSDKPFFASRIPNALYAIAWYLQATCWPAGLFPAHVHVGNTMPAWATVACLVAVVGLVAAAVRLGRSWPFLPVGLGWFLVALLPMLGLVQTGEQGYADRFTYVPHVGLAVGLVWAGAKLLSGNKASPIVGSCAVGVAAALCVAVSERKLTIWQNPDTLWLHAIEVDPRNYHAHYQRGWRLWKLGRIEEAEPYLLMAEQVTPDNTYVVAALAEYYQERGMFAEAAARRRHLVKVAPQSEFTRQAVRRMRTGRKPKVDESVRAILKEGLAEARQGRYGPALEAFERAIELDRDCAEAHNNAGLACAELGRREEARRHFQRAIELNPHHADYRVNAVQLLCLMDRWDEAARECEIALEIDPFDAEARKLEARISRRLGGGR